MLLIKKIFATLTLSVLLLTCCGCSTKLNSTLISPYTTAIDQVLATSGSNRIQIEQFLNKYGDNPEKRQAAQFLIANLPPSDRVSLSTKLLEENLDYAFLARESTPWGKDVSWSDFLHYVLPHRVSQEKAVKWRKLFYNELLPIVSECRTTEEATLAVNKWCFSKTGFKSTQRWDQNPLMTVNRGWGRCEEAVILTVSALRSLGIPARQAMVPAWQHSNDNHTWTEVKTNEKWHYLESANPDFGLDHAWFTGAARKAPLVVSYAYGQAENPLSPILGRPFGCTLINTTKHYAPVSRTQIKITDKTNKPIAGVKVYISVFNYASFRPVAAKITDANGNADILLGPGSVLLSAASGNNTAYVGSTWIPGEQKSRDPVLMKLTPHNLPEGNILFRFAYEDTQASTAPPKNSEGTKKAEYDSIKNIRLKKFDGMTQSAKQFDANIYKAVTKAGLNTPQILVSINNCPEKIKPILIKNIKNMAAADLVTAKSKNLINDAALAMQTRKETQVAGIEYSDEIFEKFVLDSRIMYEQQRPWREKLHSRFNLGKTKRLDHLLNKIGSFTKDIKTVVRGPLGSSIDPLGVYDSQTASSQSEICVFATAAIRSCGIPARFLDEQGWVEFYNGSSWQPFYPEHPQFTGNRNATDESKAFYSPWTSVKFSLPGFKNKNKQPQYFKDFTISQLNKHVFFSIIEKTVQGGFDEKNNIWHINIPTGNFFLISAKRNKENEPAISIVKIRKTNHNQSK